MMAKIKELLLNRLGATCVALAAIGVTVGGCADVGSYGGGFFGVGKTESALGSYLAGRHARIERDTKAAADFFAFALSEDPKNRTLQHRTFLLMLAEGEIGPALALADSLAKDKNTASMAELVLTTEDIRMGRYDSAIARLGTPPKRGFGALLKPLLLAWAHAGQNDMASADAALEVLANRDAFRAFQVFHTALIKDHLGDLDGARTAYEKMDENSGVTTSVTLGYGSLLQRAGDGNGAERIYAKLLSRVPENPAVLAARADLKAGKRAEPLIRNISDGVAQAYYGAAGALARERGRDAARIYSHLALHLRPDFDSARMLLGEIFERDRRWREAINVYRNVPAPSPFYWEARIRVATSLDEVDKVDEAIATLSDMAEQRPRDTIAIVTLADLLRSRERYIDAAKAYDTAIGRLGRPKERHWALFYARGISQERNKQWDQAEADFLRALELKPDHPLVLNYLGYSWIEQGRHIDRALKMIEKAVAQRPNDGYIVDSLGWAYYQMKDYESAVKHLERAVELKPQDPVINDHLGDAFWQVGRRIEARFQWRHALALDPDKTQIPKIKKKLEKGLTNLARANGGN